MFEFFLASVIWANIGTQPPDIIARFKTEKECLADMTELNKKIDTPEAKEMGAEFICLKVTRGIST